MQDLLRLFPFFVILTTGASLECEVCYGLGTRCSGKMATCSPKKDTCVIAFAESTLEGRKIRTVEKTCDSSKVCSTPSAFFYLGLGRTFRMYLVCCTGDNCKNAKPKLPQVERKVNGKQCPTCYSSSEVCHAKLVNCTGLESYCFDVATSTYINGQRQRSIMKGCTTKSICASINRGQADLLTGADVVEKATCTPEISRGSQSSALLLPTFPVLLLQKILS
ncbi:phospholipase A2 inhibitor and Ly6/PLAUR domain-containing protein-like isoform X1 [Podarcis raffonei]|uniref:phospholipase A2 inhibitor and Ly6/PLAUR domain-containing protein-like isoform X1 n=1 Tax=Podarcis raffonei TaxID=65483 RepID=UPI0023293994|nr:phospholipase A2 inhibitor and Ly6/PLAUR domain-containing protein-like isoform X1 [Podarcis raffonei]